MELPALMVFVPLKEDVLVIVVRKERTGRQKNENLSSSKVLCEERLWERILSYTLLYRKIFTLTNVF
jgi:hypothetical protein